MPGDQEFFERASKRRKQAAATKASGQKALTVEVETKFGCDEKRQIKVLNQVQLFASEATLENFQWLRDYFVAEAQATAAKAAAAGAEIGA